LTMFVAPPGIEPGFKV